MKLIDADALEKEGWYLNRIIQTDKNTMKYQTKKPTEFPAIEPEREKGEWEEIEVIPEAYDIAGVKTWASKMRCNQCGFTTSAIEGRFAQYNFCPNCGVNMKGEQDDND